MKQQREITAGIPPHGEPCRIARQQLAEFEKSLDDFETHLEQIEETMRLAAACQRSKGRIETNIPAENIRSPIFIEDARAGDVR